MKTPTIQVPLKKVDNRSTLAETASVPVEMLVSLTVNGSVWLDFLCTPQYLEALAVGFLYNEGAISGLEAVAQVYVCPEQDNVDVWTISAIEKPSHFQRTSGCSGGVSIAGNSDRSTREDPWIESIKPGIALQDCTLSPNEVNDLVNELYKAQTLHQESGGVHASALSDGQSLFLVCEDIGRHNTLDKLAGRLLLEKTTDPCRVVLTTGRISSEMLQKAAYLGTPIVISSTSPTSYAIRMADMWNITLIGYARQKHFSIYSHPERIYVPSR